MKDISVPTLLAIALLIVGIFDGATFIKNKQFFGIYAQRQSVPKNIRTSNVSDSSFTISWTTDRQTTGFVRWGENQSFLTKVSLEATSELGFVHSTTINGLNPDTSYYFKINSGGEDFDNNDAPWQIHTGIKIPDQPEAYIISGKIVNSLNQPVQRAAVYVTVGGSSPLSDITTNEGLWTVNITSARQLSLDSFILIDEKKTPIEIFVQAGPEGMSSAQLYPMSGKPVPEIMLGKIHNFTNSESAGYKEVPKAEIEFP